MPHKIAISRRELHLAAYVKAHGAELTSYVNGNFYFSSEIPESDWRVEHAGSDALRVDQELLALRRFVV